MLPTGRTTLRRAWRRGKPTHSNPVRYFPQNLSSVIAVMSRDNFQLSEMTVPGLPGVFVRIGIFVSTGILVPIGLFVALVHTVNVLNRGFSDDVRPFRSLIPRLC